VCYLCVACVLLVLLSSSSFLFPRLCPKRVWWSWWSCRYVFHFGGVLCHVIDGLCLPCLSTRSCPQKCLCSVLCAVLTTRGFYTSVLICVFCTHYSYQYWKDLCVVLLVCYLSFLFLDFFCVSSMFLYFL